LQKQREEAAANAAALSQAQAPDQASPNSN